MTIAPSPPSNPSRPGGSTAAVSEAPGYDRRDWERGYRNVEQELQDVQLTAARGAIPPALRGTLYRNGPGRLERSGQWVHHPFDGDGMICAFRFENGGARFSNRFVRTEGWKADEQAGRFLHRGVFGTQKPGGPLANVFDLRLNNIANTHVVPLGDQLLALWEASSPHGLDPRTLQTHGLASLDGVLSPGEPFSAHPRFDPGHHGEPRMVTYSVKSGPVSTIRLMEFATEGEHSGTLLKERFDRFNGFAFLHDFALTPRWAVFMRNAMTFNPLPFALGLKGAAQCLQSKVGEAGEFWLIPRGDGQPLKIPAPPGFVFHHLNAFEHPPSGEVVVDSIVYDDFPSIGPDGDFRQVDFDRVPAGRLQRCRLNPSTGAVRSEVLESRTCEFAMVNPHRQGREARYAWMAVTEQERGNAPLQAIEKLDLLSGERRIWSAAPRGFVSEPVMVPIPLPLDTAPLPRPSDGVAAPEQEGTAPAGPRGCDEDAGWVLVLVWNAARDASDLVILDAASMDEVAVLELPLAIPYGLHGTWASL